MVIPKETKRDVGYYLTALLNSKLVFFYITSYSPYVQAKYYSFEPQYLKLIPIVEYEESNPKCKKISELSKQLHLFLKKNPTSGEEKSVKDMRKEIDDLVFDLYGITDPKEKAIIEESLK